MIKRSQVLEDDLQVNMTPMLDVVFIMLIFFIVTAVFVKEAGIDVLRPSADTATVIKRVAVMIGIHKNNTIWINKKAVALEDVRYIVAKLKEENPKGRVVIKADKDSHSGLVVAIVEQLNALGITGVSIATQQGEAS